MEMIPLYALAARKSAWLAARQAVVAENVANANTPGYLAKDVKPFGDVLAQTSLEVASTNSGHLSLNGADPASDLDGVGFKDDANQFDVSETGNTVGVETEMMKAGEVNRDYALTTNIMKSFHAMLMASLKA